MNAMVCDRLIIFVKNEQPGKVKTRLAKDIGEKEALNVYRKLLRYTLNQVESLKVCKEVWYADYIEKDDIWSDKGFDKRVQEGEGLGERMSKAFEESYQNGNDQKVILIGSDCGGLTSSVITEAFEKLDQHEVVVGPAEDGGYYLIGMRRYYPELFRKVPWSTDQVWPLTRVKLENAGLSYHVLQMLNDVDTLQDWQKLKQEEKDL